MYRRSQIRFQGIAISPTQRIANLLEEIELADQAGLDAFGVGEHHRPEFLDSAPAIIPGCGGCPDEANPSEQRGYGAERSRSVRVFQEFATLDLISNGRAEMVVGRGSFVEAFPLFGLKLEDYDSLFAEKLDLLLEISRNTHVEWSGKHRAALTGQGVYPRPVQNPLPIWLGVGGTPQSFVRAGTLGLPLMVAIIGGEHRRFRSLIDLYRKAGLQAGHSADKLSVGIHSLGFVGETTAQAADDFFPGYAHLFTAIGKERGWPATTRAHFNSEISPRGAMLLGDPNAVVDKILSVNEVLGGIARISFQMTNVLLQHSKMLRAIELLGSKVAPAVKKALTPVSV